MMMLHGISAACLTAWHSCHSQVTAGMAYLRNISPDELVDLVDYFDATYVTGIYNIVPVPAAHAGGDGTAATPDMTC